jgi:hypothetical protein
LNEEGTISQKKKEEEEEGTMSMRLGRWGDEMKLPYKNDRR